MLFRSDYVRERIFANRRALDNVGLLFAEAEQWPNIGTLDGDVVAGEVKAPAWTRDGGISAGSIAATLDFFASSGSLPPSIDADRAADLSVLADALRAVASNESGATGVGGRP